MWERISAFIWDYLTLIVAVLVSIALLVIMWAMLPSDTSSNAPNTVWIQVKDNEVVEYQQRGYVVVCDNARHMPPYTWNCYAIPEQEVER